MVIKRHKSFFRYNLNEETEKRKNSEMLYNKTKEQLARKDEQYTQCANFLYNFTNLQIYNSTFT